MEKPILQVVIAVSAVLMIAKAYEHRTTPREPLNWQAMDRAICSQMLADGEICVSRRP
jgi:hypothetical protein